MKGKFQGLKKAVESKEPDAFELALNECAQSDNRDGLCEILIHSFRLDWHFRHEDIALLLQELRCPDAVQVLLYRATNYPEYHAVLDQGEALARKCTWALADIGSDEAKAGLEDLANCNIRAVSAYAQERLDRWGTEMARKLTG